MVPSATPRPPVMATTPHDAPAGAPTSKRHVAGSDAAVPPVMPPQVKTVAQPNAAVPTVPPASPSPEAMRAEASCPTIEAGAEAYIEARSQGLKTFKATRTGQREGRRELGA